MSGPMSIHRCDTCGLIYTFGIDHDACREVERRKRRAVWGPQ